MKYEGRCLDALKAGRSLIPHAGRGAFVQWDIPAGQIVTAVPVIPIAKQALWIQRIKQEEEKEENKNNQVFLVEGYQLLLNYVLGHPQSSTVLVPFGPLFSLVNHASANGTTTTTVNKNKHNPQTKPNKVVVKPNVRLQWSSSTTLFRHREWLSYSPSNTTTTTRSTPLWMQNHSGLLLDLVAIRDLKAGEEVLLDYGPDWDAAWMKHVQDWTPPPNSDSYAPSYVHDDAILQARTEKELLHHPYPEHIFTSCFFPVNHNETILRQHIDSGTAAGGGVTTVKWVLTRGMFEYTNLRPCRIIERHGTKYKNVFLYTIQILNRYGLRKEERLLSSSSPLIVTHVPRKAIRLSDKIYTTDQHLPHAFRHSINLPDDVFPDAWKDDMF